MKETVEHMAHELLPLFAAPARAIVTVDFSNGDMYMACDDMLQFSLISGIRISAELLAEIEEVLESGDYDPEIIDRTWGWVTQHKRLQEAAA